MSILRILLVHAQNEYKHKSSSDTQFVCKRCKYTFGRHFVGAINIAKKGIGVLNDCFV